MKKGLSILLVAAALFGFYGGATNLNDVLACKDYWEKAGEESTANMNKLEDGLNQLKENEQAYLDGQDQLAEGEKTLADGEAQYAQGLADYEAAPAKLAAGEKQLAEGKESYKKLNQLISGLNTAQKHGNASTKTHDKYWHDAFTNSLAPGRQLIVGTLKQKSDMVSMLESLTGVTGLIDDAEKAGSYPAFDTVVDKKLRPTFEAASKALYDFADLAESKAADLQGALNAYNGLTAGADTKSPGLETIWAAPMIPTEAGKVSFKDLLGDCNAQNEYKAVSMQGSPYAALKPAFDQLGLHKHPYAGMAKASALLRGGVASQLSDFLGEYGEMLEGVATGNAEFAQLLGAVKALAVEGGADAATFSGYMPAVIGGLTQKAAPALRDYAKTAQDSADQFDIWHKGYQKLAHAKDGKTSKEYPDDLASKSSGIPYAFQNIVSNPTTKAAVKAYDKGLMKILKRYTGDRLKNDSMEQFDKDITYIANSVIPRAQKVLSKVKADANRQLDAGKAQLADGYKSYREAPAKLADAEKQLADGRQQLADGKAQLAQYEDGEQQVRDGLKTLTDTEADLDLESIADRLNGDTDFDNGDAHLDIDEGLAAVDVGRGYQAEDGVLITDEIMARAVGTGALLAAGALAILAAILSFLKKNKGAGVFAILAAAAGAFGAFYGTQAGTYFSSIAGSTVGATGWVAAGILGAVALVHSIVHFTAKKDA